MLRNTWNDLLSDIRSNKKVAWQTAALFGSQLVVVILGFAIKGIQTRGLGPEEYGLYAFFGTVTGILAIFYRFGHYNSIKVLLAENDHPRKEREYFGLGLLISLGVGLLFALTIFVFSYAINGFFSVEYGNIFRTFAPLTLVFPLHFMIGDLSIGSNRIYPSALVDVAAKSLFLIPLFIIYQQGQLVLSEVIFLNLLTLFIAIVTVFIWLKPSFQNLSEHFKTLRRKNREYGWYFYFGSVTNQTTFRLDEVFISAFINTTQLGFYTLASIICTPMVMLSKALSSSMFKRFASSKCIPPKIFVYNYIWLGACVVGLFFLAEFIVATLFGSEYATVAEYVVLLSLAYFFQGAYQPFNFLAAKSKGKEIRNVAFIEAATNVIGNIILIWLMGIYGVILASIIARLVHFSGLWYYYQQYKKQSIE